LNKNKFIQVQLIEDFNILEYEAIIQELESLSKPENVKGMARFGINSKKVYGIKMPELRHITKKTGKNHELAEKLWHTGYNETKIRASLIEDPKNVTEDQMEKWAIGFNSWDSCDHVVSFYSIKLLLFIKKIFEWSERKEEFIKRAAFTLISVLAVYDKKSTDNKFKQFYPLIIRESTDNRNYVKKAVNWALRQK
jgi:3-methyladenine DNA glycosylase AlkD